MDDSEMREAETCYERVWATVQWTTMALSSMLGCHVGFACLHACFVTVLFAKVPNRVTGSMEGGFGLYLQRYLSMLQQWDFDI